jgi:hypothetical protein
MVMIKVDRDESGLKVYENRKIKEVHQFKNRNNDYFFFSGFDVQYFARKVDLLTIRI